jgi:ribosomal protein S21
MVCSRTLMATNVQVEKHTNESSANVIRRFQKRVQGAGIIQRVRGNRYHSRGKSRNVRREARLKKLVKKQTYEKLLKLGKVAEAAPRTGRRS